jgi:oxygen-independent coproporphyrinogen-3 oxidase
MIAAVNIELYRYEIHSLLKAFYPEEDVRVVVTGQEPRKKKDLGIPWIYIDYAQGSIRVRIPEEDRSAALQAPAGDNYAAKGPACKGALKHLLYDFLSACTGKSLPWGELIGIRPTKIAMQHMAAGASAEETAAYMEKEFRVSREKSLLAVDIAERERRILSDIHYKDGYSLYVGVPFCPTTCLYCSFTSFPIAAWRERVDAYLDALIREIRETSGLMKGRILDTVYIGGGTPTTLEPDQLDRLLTAIETWFPMDRIQEFTVEAGRPDSITAEKLRTLRRHKITRISVNPQTMKEETLKIIGRRHTVDQTVQAFRLARQEGFDNINMDIILGLPEETPEDVAETLRRIEELDPDSLTVHSLAVKRASRLQQWIEQNGFSALNNTDESMRIAAEGAARMGMVPYYLYRQKNMSGNFENVGYAREGRYGIYNILIMEETQSILALGAGSISKALFENCRIERAHNCKAVATYIETIDEMLARKRRPFGR